MPNSPTIVATTTDEALSRLVRSLAQPSLENLSYALRHPETWPDDFTWNFAFCGSCAMGLASKLWSLRGEVSDDIDVSMTTMARTFAMDLYRVGHIFGSSEFTERWWRNAKSPELVTPAEVADAIDRYVAAQRASVRA